MAENFLTPEKGVWGNEEGETIYSDFSGITRWNLKYDAVTLYDNEDYGKTVTTSGGRFEARDINGEVTWSSEWINISEFKNIKISLYANETGSGANADTKYLKAFYKLNNSNETLFENNGLNTGNWGSHIAEQKNLQGDSVQIIVYISTHYSSDKVILDEISVTGEYKIELPPIGLNDIVINEILVDPFPGCVDFVELYNNSPKTIWLNRLSLATKDNNNGLKQICPVSSERYDFLPGTFILCTTDSLSISSYYYSENTDCFFEMENLPTFPNKEGTVVLLNDSNEIVDEFTYSDKMHSPFLYDTEGVSLERISYTKATNLPTNWYSASESVGYATPGYKNSQTFPEKPKTEFYIEPEAISPNNDGYNDILNINYQVSHPGYIANILIFDTGGRLITELAKNEILGTEGKLTWNGKDEYGQKLLIGIYIILFEIFDINGNVEQYKEAVVLTERSD